MIYSVIPEELAPELYERLVEYYKDDPNDIPDTSKTLARMTSANVKAAAKHYLTDSKDVYQAVRMPKTDTDKPKK